MNFGLYRILYFQKYTCQKIFYPQHHPLDYQNNNWISPEEIEIIDKKYYKKNDKNSKIIVGPSESMSKSKKNVIDPEEIIKNYGSDAARWFMLSDSPPERDINWSDSGIHGSWRFCQKIWTTIIKNISLLNDSSSNLKIENYSNKSKALLLDLFLNVACF